MDPLEVAAAEALAKIQRYRRKIEVAKFNYADCKYGMALVKVSEWWEKSHPGTPMTQARLESYLEKEEYALEHAWEVANPGKYIPTTVLDSLSNGSKLIMQLRDAGRQVHNARSNQYRNRLHFDRRHEAHPGKWLVSQAGTYVPNMVFDTKAAAEAYMLTLPKELFIDHYVIELREPVVAYI